MAGVTIRGAAGDDAASIAQVQHTSWRSAYLGMLPHEVMLTLDEAQGESFWRSVLASARARDTVLVAELEDDIAGFVSFGPIRERIPGYNGEFYALYVLPEAQGCGIGTSLLAQAARALVRQRWVGATVWVLEENHLGRRFYERLGGLPLGAAKTLHFRGQAYPKVRELAYGWPDLRRARWLVEQ